MSVLDKFLTAIHLNDDMDVDDDEFLDDDNPAEDMDDSRPGRRLIRRGDDLDDVPPQPPVAPSVSSDGFQPKKKEKKSLFGSRTKAPRQPADDEYDDSRADEVSGGRSRERTSASKISAFRPRRTVPEDEETNNYSVCVIRPKSMEDALEIAKTLVSGCVVILNLEGLDLDVSQRLFDFASGSCCAIQGRLDKISNYIFVLTPKGINISGEFQEIITGTFDPDLPDDDEDY